MSHSLQREKAFAENMAAGKSIKQSMLDAGYPLARANRGVSGMTKKMVKALSAEGQNLAEFGKSLSLETLKHIAIGRLATNAINGKDGGVMSAKVIGSHRDLNLWTPEAMAGVIVLGIPQQVLQHKDKLLEADSE